MRKLERFANGTAKPVNDGFMLWPKWRCIMKILKGLGKYWHPNADPSGKHDCNFSNRNLQFSATLAKRLCRGGVLVISASCIPFYIHVQLAVMLSFHAVQHAQIEKCIPRRFCIKQNNQLCSSAFLGQVCWERYVLPPCCFPPRINLHVFRPCWQMLCRCRHGRVLCGWHLAFTSTC